MSSSTTHYEMHGDGTADIAIFTFGSFVNPNRTAPSYAFMNTCLGMRARHDVRCDVYYFLAQANDWYFGGVRGLGGSFADSVRTLEGMRSRYRRSIYVGNSMGGFAALGFGFLTGATRVLAFSPQTRLDRAFLTSIREARWKSAIELLQATYRAEDYALETIIAGAAPGGTQASVYVGRDSPQDLAHAERLRGVRGVAIHEIEGEGHDLVHAMRANGELEKILYAAVSG